MTIRTGTIDPRALGAVAAALGVGTLAGSCSMVDASLRGISKMLAALLVGAAAWLAATVASQVVPEVVFGLELQGPAYAWVALLQLVLCPLAVLLGLRVVVTYGTCPVPCKAGD